MLLEWATDMGLREGRFRKQGKRDTARGFQRTPHPLFTPGFSQPEIQLRNKILDGRGFWAAYPVWPHLPLPGVAQVHAHLRAPASHGAFAVAGCSILLACALCRDRTRCTACGVRLKKLAVGPARKLRS